MPEWLLLVVSIPTASATARMRVWRALKAMGCMALRDGAYLAPHREEREQALRDLGDECIREGASAWLIRRFIDQAIDAASIESITGLKGGYNKTENVFKRRPPSS